MTSKVQIKYIAINKLLPYAKNARTHSAKQIKKLLKAFNNSSLLIRSLLTKTFK